MRSENFYAYVSFGRSLAVICLLTSEGMIDFEFKYSVGFQFYTAILR